MKTMSLRLSDDLHDLIVEAAEAEERSRHQWIVRALERAVTQAEPKVRRGPALLSDTPEGREELKAIIHDAQGVEPGNLRTAASAAKDRIEPVPVPDVDPATGEILSDGPPKTAMDRARTRSHSTSQKYLVRATYKGLFWVCFVEGTELTFNVRSKPDIARTARRFLEGQTEGEFTVEVRT